MPQAQLRIELPTTYWLGSLSRNFPSLDVEVVSVVGRDAPVFQVDLQRPDVSDPLSALANDDSVTDVELLARGETEASCVVAVDADPIVAAACEAGTPIRFPVEVRDGRATLRLGSLGEQLAGFESLLEKGGVSWSVDHIKQSVASDPVLTRRQRYVLETALVEGYYDTPRRCTLTELATELDIAKSTCSETLHRAESAVMEQFLGGADPDGATTRHHENTGGVATPTGD